MKTVPEQLEFHEAANIFPLDEENLDTLAEDIQTSPDGLQESIKLLDGKILDGRRRYLACRKVGVEPRFVDVRPADPVAYVVSLNIHRRHLSVSQLSMCAARATKLKDRYKQEAADRQREALARGNRTRHAEKLPVPENLPESGDTRDHVGKLFGVSGNTVDHAARVLEQATPKLVAAVDADQVAVSTASRASSLSEAEQDAIADRAAETAAKGHRRKKRPSESRAEPAEPEPNGEREVKGVGIVHAYEAINCLSRIPKNDALRKRGFQLVTDWVRRNP